MILVWKLIVSCNPSREESHEELDKFLDLWVSGICWQVIGNQVLKVLGYHELACDWVFHLNFKFTLTLHLFL